MTKLRDKTHIVLFILVAAFLGLIIFEWGMNFTGPSKKSGLAGKIDGVPVTMKQYEETVNFLGLNFRQSNPGEDITPQREATFREQAWNMIIEQVLFEQLFKKYGLTATDQEVVDAVNNEQNPPMIIRQNFTDPKTGGIDRQLLERARRDPQAKEFWLKAQDAVKRELKIGKLVMALKSMAPVNDAELTELVQRQFTMLSGSFIPVPLAYAGAESQFPVKDAEVTAWYEAHKAQFRQEPVRSAQFVYFPLVPSAQDSLSARKEIDGLLPQFAAAPKDSEFVKIQSDIPEAVNVSFSRADFTPVAGNAVFGSPKLAPLQIIGPIADHGYYRLLKIKSLSNGEPTASASHILIPFNPGNRADADRAVALARQIYGELQKGAPFASLAAKYSADTASARNGGFVGWFTRERMVPQFSQAVFAGKPGQIVGPVITQFGLHIIRIEGFDSRKIVCAQVARMIKPSSQTSEMVKRSAVGFQSDAKVKGFDETAKSRNLFVGKTGEFSRQTLAAMPGMNDAVTRFAFSAKEGEISDVLDSDKGFVVMKLLAKNDTGYRLLDGQLKPLIRSVLVQQKQGAALKLKLASMSKAAGGSLDGVAAQDPKLKKVSSGRIYWRDGSIEGYGIDRQLVESMAGMKLNQLSQPVPIADGYALAVVTGRQIDPSVNIDAEKNRILPQLIKVKQEQFINEYLKEYRNAVKIEDFR